MVQFGLMLVEGFGPIKNSEFNWDLPGLNIIQAPNGYGKTKFINSLFWGLYGKTLSGSVETWEHLRGKDYQGTKVEVNFSRDNDRVKVIRCKEYTGRVEGAKGKKRLIVKINGEELKVKDKKDIQKELELIIGYSSDLFKNSIIFGQKLKRLITETGPNKKKVFDEAFEVTYLAKARTITENERDPISEAWVQQYHRVEGIVKDWDNIKEKVNRENEIKDNFEKSRKENITEQQFYITQNLERISLLGDIDNKLGIIKRKLIRFNTELRSVGIEHNILSMIGKLDYQLGIEEKERIKIEKDIIKVENNLNHIPSSCERCGRIFTEKEIKEERVRVEIEIKNLRVSLVSQATNISCTKGYLAEAKRDASSIQTIKKQVELLKNSKNELEDSKNERAKLLEDNLNRDKTIESLKGQVLKNNYDQYTRDLRSIEQKLLEEKSLLRQIHKNLKLKDWLISDPLSNHGIKAWVFNTMLDDVNKKLEYYSQFIGFQVVFDMDMESYNKDLITYVYNGDNIIPYDDLSGGQQQSVDVVSAFAIHDVVNEARECNLLIMDEIFESLDKNNIEIVTELIQDKALKKSLYLITHIDNFIPTGSNILKIDFNNGFTSMT